MISVILNLQGRKEAVQYSAGDQMTKGEDMSVGKKGRKEKKKSRVIASITGFHYLTVTILTTL